LAASQRQRQQGYAQLRQPIADLGRLWQTLQRFWMLLQPANESLAIATETLTDLGKHCLVKAIAQSANVGQSSHLFILHTLQ
jgi:hypothetical protein